MLAMDVRRKYLGTELSPTGDPLIDMWERQIAAGEVPDLDACEDPKIKEKDRQIQEAARRHFEETGERVYIPDTPVSIEDIERLRAESDPWAFDAEEYQRENTPSSSMPPSPHTTHQMMDRRDISEALRDVSPEAFDLFLNSYNLLKK